MNHKSATKYLTLIAVALVVLSLSVSGCTTPSTTTPTQAPGTTTLPATGDVTATPTTSSGTTEGKNPWLEAFKFDQLHWYTYTKVGGTKVKIVYADEAYNGQPARKITTYIDDKKTQESYYDFANDQFLAGTSYIIPGMEQEMSSSDFDSLANDVYFTFNDPEDYTQGLKSSADTVTTAAGTFSATKYVTDNKYDTFWVSNDAPLPVRYYSSVTDFTWEPTGWG